MKYIHQYNHYIEIKNLNENQKKLSDSFSVHLPKVEEIGYLFRAELDKYVHNNEYESNLVSQKVFEKYQENNFDSDDIYPIGMCFHITKAFCMFLKMSNYDFIHQYISLGGVFKIVWGNIRNEFFQTALQIGDFIVDVANDTVDINKPKVKISRIGEIDFKNFTSFDEYIKVKESYHSCEIIINTYIPEIYDFAPLIERKNGEITFLNSYVLTYLIKEKNSIPTPNNKELNQMDRNLIFSYFNSKMRSKINAVNDPFKKEETVNNVIKFFNKAIAKSSKFKIIRTSF